MPCYDYQCKVCKQIKEVEHPMAEVGNPSEKTLQELQCCGETMVRVYISVPSIKTPTMNRFLDQSRRKRNSDHFKKEVLPTITDPDARKHHLNKAGYKS